MNQNLLLGLKVFAQAMRIDITEEQKNLKEQHACRPNRRRPPKPGENRFGQDRLDLKKEHGAQENRYSVKKQGNTRENYGRYLTCERLPQQCTLGERSGQVALDNNQSLLLD